VGAAASASRRLDPEAATAGDETRGAALVPPAVAVARKLVTARVAVGSCDCSPSCNLTSTVTLEPTIATNEQTGTDSSASADDDLGDSKTTRW
jgi:hypothetical protein